MEEMVQYIEERFESVRIPEKAVWMKGYMKDLFEFYGVPAPQRKVIFSQLKPELKEFSIDELFDLAEALWCSEYRELHYLAIDILQWKKKYIRVDHLPRVKQLIEINSWWDSVDAIASHLVGHILSLDRDLQLKTSASWLASDDIWLQRSIIIHQLRYKEKFDEKLLFDSILSVLPTKEFFLQKAAGWALRSYAKYEPQSVLNFVDTHELPKLTEREAVRSI